MTGRHKFSALIANKPPEWRADVARLTKEMQDEMDLTQLRTAHQLSQAALGEILHVEQPAVAKLEKRADMYVSTLRRFIEAMGGELEITARFPDHSVRITNFSDLGKAGNCKPKAIVASGSKPMKIMTNTGLENDLWEPIQLFINELQNEFPEKAVHHYTSARAALSILENGKIRLTERAHLNDRSEISYGVEIAKVALAERGWARDAESLQRKADDVFCNFRFFSASFSFEPDDISQWKNYADDGQGVVLSFGLSAFKNPKSYVDTLLPGNPTAIVCPMSYGHMRLKQVIEAIINKWDRADVCVLLNYVFVIASMFKEERWASEREFRLFVHTTRENALRCGSYKTQKPSGDLVEYLDLDIQNWKGRESDVSFPVWSARVGPAAPNGLEAQLSDFIRARGIPIPDVRRSEA